MALAKSLGCDFAKKGEKPLAGAVIKSIDEDGVDPSLRRVLPRVYVDGPFGSASEDVFKFEVAVLCGAGIGVTPFASILKSIWYRMNYPQGRSRLRKVYFFWIIRDFGSLEWFRSLLKAIEAQDMDHAIEIHTVSAISLIPPSASLKLNSMRSTSPPKSAWKMRRTL
jgi:NADPH oxidase